MSAAQMDPVFKVVGDMTIYRASELKQDILARLAVTPNLEFDLSEVSELDTAGVQLLFLANLTAVERQGGIRVAGRSAAVKEVFALLALDDWFPVRIGEVTATPDWSPTVQSLAGRSDDHAA